MERLGVASALRPKGRLVWFHAASVGESLSILPLIERLQAERPGVAVLVTSGTVTSAQLLAKRLPDWALHQFAPVDVEPAVTRFLDHWRPDLAVWIESEIWPRLVWSVGERGIPALLLNARMGAQSRKRWRHLRDTAPKLFGVFDYVQAQDDQTAAALRDLGVAENRLRIAGSFKEAAPPLPCDEAELAALREATAGRFVWVAASTHPGEEALAIAAHRRILDVHPGALLILVPRHPARGDDVAELLDASQLAWGRRADGPPPAGASVYLADTMGELGLWYRLAAAALVGGSTGGVGGHNPYEPVALGVPVLHGPDTANFDSIYNELDAAQGALRVLTSDEIADAVLSLAPGPKAAATARRAAEIAGKGSKALDQAVEAILTRLP